ncbi:MAG: hypothetical protein OXC48_11260, partial [Endozoicomonadaceae bacterium]|nr:hypothetical protein [Endozoicomonadaceae bacterium]
DSNAAAAGADAAEAGNSAANAANAVYEPGRTYNLLTKELANFTEDRGDGLRLYIPNNNAFKVAWNKIINLGIGVKNNTRKLFLMLAQLRSVENQGRSLAWLADYLDAQEYGVDVNPAFSAVVKVERYFTGSFFLRKTDYLETIDNAMSKNQLLILPTEEHPYYTFGSQLTDGLWELIHVDSNNGSMSINMINMIREDPQNNIFMGGYLRGKNTYTFTRFMRE